MPSHRFKWFRGNVARRQDYSSKGLRFAGALFVFGVRATDRKPSSPLSAFSRVLYFARGEWFRGNGGEPRTDETFSDTFYLVSMETSRLSPVPKLQRRCKCLN